MTSAKYTHTSHLFQIFLPDHVFGLHTLLQIKLPPRPLSLFLSSSLSLSEKTKTTQWCFSPLVLYFFFISMEYCVYLFFSSRSAPRVTAFPGFWCYQVGASIHPSSVLKSEAGSKQYEIISFTISLLVNAGHVMFCLSVYTSHWEFSLLTVYCCLCYQQNGHSPGCNGLNPGDIPAGVGVVKENVSITHLLWRYSGSL